MRTAASPIQNRIGVVFIPVNDMERARAWYGKLFGVEPGTPSHESGICDIPMQDGLSILLDANTPVTEHSVQPLCFFWTEDMPATLEHLQSIGAAITSDVTDIGSVAFVTFRDPDGNPLMVCQRQ